jgi:hypothetical protein
MPTITRKVQASDSLAAVRKCPKTYRGERMTFVSSKRLHQGQRKNLFIYELTFKKREKK